MEKRYIQLYSIKEDTAKDFISALKRVAGIGYTGVEFAAGNYGGFKAGELKKVLEELNLEPLSTHIMSDHVAEHVNFALELGIKYIIDPMANMGNYEEAAAFAKKLNATGKICKDNGIVFGYHNHRHEFLESKDGTLMDTLLVNTDPDLVCFQLDVGWATCAGCDVPEFIRKHTGRFKLIHFKECSKVAGPEQMLDFGKFPKDENGLPQVPPDVIKKFQEQNKWNVAAGKGVINWPSVRDAALIHGAEAFIVEREYDYAGDMFKSIEEDCAYLKSL